MSASPPPAAPEGSPSPRMPRWGFAVVIASLAVVVVATTTAVVVAVTRDSGTSSAGGSPVASTTTSPSTPTATAEEELLTLIPPEPVKCQAIEQSELSELPEFQDPIAGVACESKEGFGSAIPFVRFLLYPSEESVAAVYESLRATIGIPRDSGDCSAGEHAEFSWSGGGGKGRLMCFPKEDGATVFWTSQGFPVLGSVSSTVDIIDVRGVYAVWQGISDYTR